MTCPGTHSPEELGPLRQGGLQGHSLRPDQHPQQGGGGIEQVYLHQRQETHLQADPPGVPSGLPRPEVPTQAEAAGQPARLWDLLSHQAQVEGPTVTSCLSAEVHVVGLEGSDKLSILRGCPGLPGAAGPKGDAGVNGERGRCSGPGVG